MPVYSHLRRFVVFIPIVTIVSLSLLTGFVLQGQVDSTHGWSGPRGLSALTESYSPRYDVVDPALNPTPIPDSAKLVTDSELNSSITDESIARTVPTPTPSPTPIPTPTPKPVYVAPAPRSAPPPSTSSSYSGGVAGWTDLAAAYFPNHVSTVLRIMDCESGGNPNTVNSNPSTGDLSVGLMQINLYGRNGPARMKVLQSWGYDVPNLDAAIALLQDPSINMRFAQYLSGGSNFNPWTCY